jgi:hypothetical protein
VVWLLKSHHVLQVTLLTPAKKTRFSSMKFSRKTRSNVTITTYNQVLTELSDGKCSQLQAKGMSIPCQSSRTFKTAAI